MSGAGVPPQDGSGQPGPYGGQAPQGFGQPDRFARPEQQGFGQQGFGQQGFGQQGYPAPPAGQPHAPAGQPYAPYAQPAAPAPALPVEEKTYLGFLRTPAYAPWRPVVALAIMGGFFILASIVQIVPIVMEMAAGRLSAEDLQAGKIPMSPFVLAFTGLGLVLLIPGALLAQKVGFRQDARWLHSVEGRLRWGWLLRSLLVMAVVWGLWMLLPSLIWGREEWEPAKQVLAYSLVTFLIIPFQAAGEEYMFRGLITRSITSWFPAERVGMIVAAVVSSALFMLVHGAGDPWLNVFYFGLGLVLCALAWRTGGLEAPIALHVVNNVMSFQLATWSGQMDKSFDRAAGVGDPSILVALAAGLITVLVLDRWRARSARDGSGPKMVAAPGRELIAGALTQPTYVGPQHGAPGQRAPYGQQPLYGQQHGPHDDGPGRPQL
ncbi:hypothetical protein GCM10027418_20550 [Mariniluteicoccus endophyticus]